VRLVRVGVVLASGLGQGEEPIGADAVGGKAEGDGGLPILPALLLKWMDRLRVWA
jgi:hypothetical protein